MEGQAFCILLIAVWTVVCDATLQTVAVESCLSTAEFSRQRVAWLHHDCSQNNTMTLAPLRTSQLMKKLICFLGFSATQIRS
jgi:hypothetical protein